MVDNSFQHHAMSPVQVNAQLRTPPSDMIPLQDEPNNYGSAPLASSTALPILSSSWDRRFSDVASSAPSSSSHLQGLGLGPSLTTSGLSDHEKLTKSPRTMPSSFPEATTSSTHASHYRSRKPHKSRSHDSAGRNAEQQDNNINVPSSSGSRHRKVSIDASRNQPGHPDGPVRGQPLIFAAMASAEAENFVPFAEDLPVEEPQVVVHRIPSISHFKWCRARGAFAVTRSGPGSMKLVFGEER